MRTKLCMCTSLRTQNSFSRRAMCRGMRVASCTSSSSCWTTSLMRSGCPRGGELSITPGSERRGGGAQERRHAVRHRIREELVVAPVLGPGGLPGGGGVADVDEGAGGGVEHKDAEGSGWRGGVRADSGGLQGE